LGVCVFVCVLCGGWVCVCVCVYVRAHAILSTAKQRLETAFELNNDQWPHPLMFCVIFFRVKAV